MAEVARPAGFISAFAAATGSADLTSDFVAPECPVWLTSALAAGGGVLGVGAGGITGFAAAVRFADAVG